MKKTAARSTRAVTPVAVNRSLMAVPFAGLLFLSGAAALIYQVLWVRQLSLVVGIQVYSITIAVSAFFAGLAGGGALFGRLVDRVVSPLRLYAALEIAVAFCALATTLLLPRAALPFVSMQEHLGPLAWVLPFVLVGVPAFLIGGTLPVAVRGLPESSIGIAQEGGLLYAANTGGGIAGVLAASFALLPSFGIRGTALAAACLNVAAAGMAFAMSPRDESLQPDWAAQPKDQGALQSRKALVLYALAGAISLGYEVVWSQAIAQFVSTRVFAFTIVLAVYLAGLAIGSWLGSLLLQRVRDSWGAFALLIAGAGLMAMLEFAVLGPWIVEAQSALEMAVLSVTGSEAMRMYASFAAAGLSIVFVPTLLLGAAFPVALRLAVGAKHVGRDVGVVIAANLAGGVAGTLAVGFALIPSLGLVRTLALLTVGAAAVGLIAVLSAHGSASKVAVGAICVAVCAAAVITPADRLANLLLATRGGGILVFYEEGRGATVAIAQQRSKDNIFRRLFIQGVSNSGDAMPSMRYMRLQAMLPLLVHDGDPKAVMIVGFGTGITAGETLRFPSLEKRVCVELLPSVVRSGQMFPENYKAWSDPKMQIRLRDGRQELMHSTEQYDVITLESPPPSAQNVSNLYSTEFYELAKKRLAPNGIFAQWLPIATQNEEETRGLVRSFLDAFPYATLWTTEMHEMLLMGSTAPIRIDAHSIQQRMAPQMVTASLKGIGIDSPAAILSTWVTGRKGLEKFAANAKPVTDDWPRVEYGPWVHPDEITRVLPAMLALKTAVPVEGASETLLAETEQKRAVLMNFYGAALSAYAHDKEAWQRSIAGVQEAEPDNAYYAWVIGRD